MKQITWAVLAAMGVAFAVPAFADDPPAPGSAEQLIKDQEAEAAAWKATSTSQNVEVRDGAGSMEPGDTKEADTQSAEDRVERDFVTNVWNSP
jgi:hypothetical protein